MIGFGSILCHSSQLVSVTLLTLMFLKPARVLSFYMTTKFTLHDETLTLKGPFTALTSFCG